MYAYACNKSFKQIEWPYLLCSVIHVHVYTISIDSSHCAYNDSQVRSFCLWLQGPCRLISSMYEGHLIHSKTRPWSSSIHQTCCSTPQCSQWTTCGKRIFHSRDNSWKLHSQQCELRPFCTWASSKPHLHLSHTLIKVWDWCGCVPSIYFDCICTVE